MPSKKQVTATKLLTAMTCVHRTSSCYMLPSHPLEHTLHMLHRCVFPGVGRCIAGGSGVGGGGGGGGGGPPSNSGDG